jgi:LPS-assembly lipoprotein
MRRRHVLLLGTAAVAGCGFELRRPPQMQFKRIALTGFAPRSTMGEALRDALRDADVTIVEDAAQAQLTLHALTDAAEKTVVASTAAGQVRDVQLRQRLKFRVTNPAGRELIGETELLLTRDMSYNETVALAKEHEEALLFRGMRSDIVQQLLRRLATLNPS